MSLMAFVAFAYVLTFIAVFIVELTRSQRLARAAGVVAIALSLGGSSTWVYAAYFMPHEATAMFRKPARHPASAYEPANGGMSLGPGAYAEPEGKDLERGEDGELDGGGNDSGSGAGSFTHKLAVAFGLVRAEQGPDDCFRCPTLIRVPAGSSPIGAPETDSEASAAEMPQQVVRVWPGFLISKSAITQSAFDTFLRQTGRTPHSCTAPIASVASDGSLGGGVAASCVTAAEAEAYTSWLTSVSGKRFRLPTAVEWEYAVRMSGSTNLNVGDVAEIVGDCWTERLPYPLAARSESAPCNHRIVKGAVAIDEARWHRPSARRSLSSELAPADVGFRVVQED